MNQTVATISLLVYFLGIRCVRGNGIVEAFIFQVPTQNSQGSLSIHNHHGRRRMRRSPDRHCPSYYYTTRTGSQCKALLYDNGDDNKDNKNIDEFGDTQLIRDPRFLERNKRWVIMVDDEEDIRLAVGDFLYDQGYQVTACADADSMLQVCAEPRSDGGLAPIPDAIISDIRMPGKDGIELLGLIRADERLARVPVILLTAKAMTQDRVEGYRAGADVYLSKPFDPNELLSIIDNAIQRRRQMSGKNGNLQDLKQDMENIKQIMRKNSAAVVKKTNVFLTNVERDVLELVCKGYTNAEIASERGVNVITINRYIQKIYVETGTRTRTELVRWAISTGYVSARIN